MNNIRQIQELNRRELENGVSPQASWHADYRDTAYVYIGGLPFELSEGDIITIFSQYGEPTYVNLVRDKETGKSRGFAFLKYEDQRSTDLAVDNLGGATIMNRIIRVDHTRYKKKDDDPEEENAAAAGAGAAGGNSADESDDEPQRPMIKEELELNKLITQMDDDDPMKGFLIDEKKEEVAKALAKLDSGKERSKSHKKREHRHRHRSRSRDGEKSRHRDERDGEKSRHRDERRRRHDDESRGDRPRRRSRTPERDGKDDRTRRRSRTPERESRRHGDSRRHRSQERESHRERR